MNNDNLIRMELELDLEDEAPQNRDSIPCEDDREAIYDDEFEMMPMEQLPF